MAIDWNRVSEALQRAIERGDIKHVGNPARVRRPPGPRDAEGTRRGIQAMLDADHITQIVAAIREKPHIQRIAHGATLVQLVMIDMLLSDWCTPMLLDLILDDPGPYIIPLARELRDDDPNLVITPEDMVAVDERFQRTIDIYLLHHLEYYRGSVH